MTVSTGMARGTHWNSLFLQFQSQPKRTTPLLQIRTGIPLASTASIAKYSSPPPPRPQEENTDSRQHPGGPPCAADLLLFVLGQQEVELLKFLLNHLLINQVHLQAGLWGLWKTEVGYAHNMLSGTISPSWVHLLSQEKAKLSSTLEGRNSKGDKAGMEQSSVPGERRTLHTLSINPSSLPVKAWPCPQPK